MSFKGLPAFLSDLIADSITGALIETAASGPRLVMQSALSASYLGALKFYSGAATEVSPAQIGLAATGVFATPSAIQLQLSAPMFSGTTGVPAFLNLIQSLTTTSAILAGADLFGFTAGHAPGSGHKDLTVDTNGVWIGRDTPATGVINGIDLGAVGSVATDVNGAVVVSHGLNVVPQIVIPIAFTAASGRGVRVAAMTSTTFTINWYDTSTKAALASTNVGFFWLAIA